MPIATPIPVAKASASCFVMPVFVVFLPPLGFLFVVFFLVGFFVFFLPLLDFYEGSDFLGSSSLRMASFVREGLGSICGGEETKGNAVSNGMIPPPGSPAHRTGRPTSPFSVTRMR